MSRKKISLGETASEDTWPELATEPPAEAAGAKTEEEERTFPVQSAENNMTSGARPKVGRVPDRIGRITSLAPQDEEKTLLEGTQATRKTFGTREERLTRADLEPPRIWDSRFALFFVVLLVLVNMGLVALLHHSHKTVSVSERPSVTSLYHDTENALAVTPPEETSSHPSETASEPSVSAPLRELPSAGPAPSVNLPARTVTTTLPPIAEPKSEPQPAAPETVEASPVAVAAPVIAAPPVPPVQVKAAPVPVASSPTDNQNLLSIINKE